MSEVSDLHLIAYGDPNSSRYKELLKRATVRQLRAWLDERAVSCQAERCCLIYAVMYRKKHRRL